MMAAKGDHWAEFRLPAAAPGRGGKVTEGRRVLVNLEAIEKIADLGEGQCQIDTGHLPFVVQEPYETVAGRLRQSKGP
jgi:hypothetical protein